MSLLKKLLKIINVEKEIIRNTQNASFKLNINVHHIKISDIQHKNTVMSICTNKSV